MHIERADLEAIDSLPQAFIDAKLSRRQFLQTSAGVMLLVGLTAESRTHGIEILADQLKDKQVAGLDNDKFMEINQDNLDNLTLGASFSPEEYGVSLNFLDDFDQHKNRQKALQGIDFTINELNIRRIRLGLRWNNIVDANGNFTFDMYQPFFDYCLENNVDICLNSGIKVFRWPEDHVPKYVLDRMSRVPPRGAKIDSNNDLAKRSLDHNSALFDYLKSSYTTSELSRIKIIQPENEPFDGFGQNQWIIQADYLGELIKASNHYFPNAKILVNTINPKDLQRISEMFSGINTKSNLQNNLVSGYDYYPYLPSIPVLPVIGSVDPISLSNMISGDLYNKNKEDAKKESFSIEITEGQAEPWGSSMEPGNSAEAFRFMILRSVKHVLDTKHDSTLRLWGVEKLANRFIDGKTTEEHIQIVDLIQTINST